MTNLGFVAGELPVAVVEPLQTNGELDVARSDDVLNLELCELGIKAELLNDAGVFAGCEARVVLRFCTSDDHFARGENERRSLGFTDTHNHSGKPLINNETG